jgi:hypothetical protein
MEANYQSRLQGSGHTNYSTILKWELAGGLVKRANPAVVA